MLQRKINDIIDYGENMKKKRLKKILIVPIIIIIGLITLITINVLNKDKIRNNMAKNALTVFMNDKDYNSKHEEYYYEIDYVEKENFLKNVNTLLEKKYNTEEINLIFKHLSDKNINKLLNLEHQDLTNYYEIKNLNVDKLDRYNNYKEKNPDYDYETVVTYVNVDLDIPDYENMNTIENPDDFWVIVNKHNKLPDGYVPSDLVSIDTINYDITEIAGVPERYARNVIKIEMVNDLKEFFLAAKQDGHNLYQTTSYRSYAWQNELYTSYVKRDGKEKADTYSARPGNSEHQTGLAIDLANRDVAGKRLNEEDELWIKENCYKYGFILRYTEENKHITRYIAESWHIRYVGKEAAKIIYENDLSLEEYVDLYITEY